MHHLDGRTRAVLTSAEITHDRVIITERLAPDLWKAVAVALKMLGGTYETRRSAFVFPFDPGPLVREATTTGVCRETAQDEGYVPTPAALAEELTTAPFSDLPRMPEGSRVLEPSAGDGRIVRAILEANEDVHVTAIEPNVQRFAHLGDSDGRVTAIRTTFEEYAAGAGKDQKFDAVVMNPPFSVAGQRSVWIDHVILAWNMLQPGGRLVAIMPGGGFTSPDRRHEDLRQLVADFGGFRPLPRGTFPNGINVGVLWLARPVPGQEGRPPYLFRHYPDVIEPVRVRYPWLTTRAVRETPVQVWRDPARHEDRVLRYRAQCWACGWLLWQFDEDNDMTLGNHSAVSSLDADEHGKAGLSVGLCFNCWNDGPTNDLAFKHARELWSKPPSQAAPVSVWSLLLREGGMVPVNEFERVRYARVQAAMREVYGVDEHAPKRDLIEAREANPWRGGPDRLAALYLREYADRLEPDADLDEVDRAALLWRGDPDAPAIALAGEPDLWGPILDQMELPRPAS